MPHPVDHVRAAGRAPAGGRRPAGGAALAGCDPGSAVRPRRHRLRRAERLLPAHGQARDIWTPERGQCRAALPQRRWWLPRRAGDRRSGCLRRNRRLPAAHRIVMYLAAEHFVRAPQWTWYILGYFFFAGLCGGCYALATLLRLVGDPRDEPAARLGFYASFAALIFCPILIDVTPADTGLIFKYWSPMSGGAWVLFILGLFVTVSALEAYWLDRRKSAQPLGGVAGRAFNIVGGVLALFFASYTGVLLSVSNQPVWSDTWMLGALFLASGLSGSAALMALLTRYRPDSVFTLDRILEAEAYFSILELVVLVLFFITIIAAGTAGRTLPMFLLWLIALAGIAASLVAARGHLRLLP